MKIIFENEMNFTYPVTKLKTPFNKKIFNNKKPHQIIFLKPGGTPAAATISANRRAVNDVNSDGFRTIVLHP